MQTHQWLLHSSVKHDGATIWDVKTGISLQTIKIVNQSISAATLSTSGQFALARSGLNYLNVIDVASGLSIGPPAGFFASQAIFHPTEAVVALAINNRLNLWDVKTNKLQSIDPTNDEYIDMFTFSLSGAEIAIAKHSVMTSASHITIANTLSGDVNQTFAVPEEVVQLEFTSDQSALVARTKKGRLFIWTRKSVHENSQ